MPRRTQKADVAVSGGVPEMTGLLDDLRALVAGARERVAVAVNRELTMLHWHIGRRIREDILEESRARYGERIVAELSRRLTEEFGPGFGRTNLLYMVQFAEVFPDIGIVQSLIGQLTWTHFLQILPLREPLQREFYAEMCRLEKWSVRTLRARIGGMLYERTALSGKPEAVIQRDIDALRTEDQLTPDMVFRDPYLLDFLGLADTYSERDLENAILREMEAFLLELGAGFAFVARQKRMTVDDEDFYLDLLFYHLDLRRFVAIELKTERFTAAHKGQMELYLRWLDRYERRPHDETPVGLILCSRSSPEQVELLQLDQGDIRVAEFFTRSLPPAVLQRELRKAVRHASEQIARRAKRDGGASEHAEEDDREHGAM